MQATQAPATTKQTTQTQTRIQETTDLSIFKMLAHNRPVVHSHVVRLAESMLERPHLRVSRPILVNEKYQVIDGQHRLKASELNGQSVYFMIVDGLTISDARLLNALQRTWSILDYAYSYASSRVPAYVQFVKTYEARELPPSVILEFMTADNRRRYNFRIGAMEPTDQKTLDIKLDQLEEILAEFPSEATPYVVSNAYNTVQKVTGYDNARMIQKLRRSKPSVQADRVSYVRELERIYNSDVPLNGPSYLRFF